MLQAASRRSGRLADEAGYTLFLGTDMFERTRVNTAGTLLLLGFLFILAGCQDRYAYFNVGSGEDNREMRMLLDLLEAETEPGENRFILMQQIANRLFLAGHPQKLILFLSKYVELNQNDPYNAYYLGIIAEAYKEMKAWPFVVHYYERILMNYPDLLVNGNSIHFLCLQELIGRVEDPHQKIEYYKELIVRFSNAIDPGASYYFLAKAYEEVGEWEQAIRAYQKFLKYPHTEIAGFPNAHVKIRQRIDFYYSGKEWTAVNLQYLVAEIKRAIYGRNAKKLLRYKAKVNFFTMSWSQAEADEQVSLVFDLGSFLHSSRVIADEKLDIDSNAGEAFLRTTRWSYRIPTWYLYFRKVDYTPDPEINGRWEWAGIYFGEKL